MISLENYGTASDNDIRALEARLGRPLPAAFLAFVRTFDGAEPAPNVFDIGDSNQSGVNRFIPVAEIWSARAHIENLSSTAFPVAWAEGGNYVIVDPDRRDAVFYWDHEIPDPLLRIADDFAAFVKMLGPFDINDVELEPGQVLDVWIDPDFLRSLDKK